MGAKRVLLTGATGFLGSYMAYEILSKSDDRLHCVARSGRRAARDRIESRLGRIAESLGREKSEVAEWINSELRDRLVVIDGDIADPHLGLAGEAYRSLEIDEIWHSAASVDFLPSRRKEIFRANVHGSETMLRLAEDSGASRFNYVSTAYVAGEKSGVVREENFDPAFPPNNPYEESKRVVEHRLGEWHRQVGIDYRILRATVLVGHSVTHRAHSSAGMYGWVGFVLDLYDEIKKVKPEYFRSNPLRVFADSGVHVNFICVDHAVECMLGIAATSRSLNDRFHVGSPVSTPLADLGRAITRAVGVEIEWVSDRRALQPYDFLFHRYAQRFNCYLVNLKHFELSNTSKYVSMADALVGRERLDKLVDDYIAQRQARPTWAGAPTLAAQL